MTSNFDRVARCYRWCEYLALGRLLERVRFANLAELAGCRKVLVLGEGDGRFLARLLTVYPTIHVTVVDGSAAMLRLAQARVSFLQTHTVEWRHQDIRAFDPSRSYDAIVTNFVLDCFTQAEADVMVRRFTKSLTPGGVWLHADFALPENRAVRPAAWLYIRALYLAFKILTGLSVTRLPDTDTPCKRAGLIRTSQTRFAAGLVFAEVWTKPTNS